jgi:hypothetical protein
MSPIADPIPSGLGSPDGAAYDVVTKIEEIIDAVNTYLASVTTEEADALELRADALEAIPATFVVVAKTGNDTTGKGSFALPYLTIAKAITLWTATRHTIYVLAGDYSEVALIWPNVIGLSLVGLGPVTISNSAASAAVLAIAPTFTASTFEATIKDIGIEAAAQIGLSIANAAMTKKLNVYIDGLEMGKPTVSGDAIDIAGTVSGQAIRVYARNLDIQGLLHFTANDAGSRLRVNDSSLLGGLTCAGSVAAECTLRNVQMLTGSCPTGMDATWRLTNIGCVHATNADPAVYTTFDDVLDT